MRALRYEDGCNTTHIETYTSWSVLQVVDRQTQKLPNDRNRLDVTHVNQYL